MPKMNDAFLSFKIGFAKGEHLIFSLVKNRSIDPGVANHI
jgi:hypothetical protein